MVRRALRSTSYRKLKRKTPGGRAVIHYERRRPSRATCQCGAELHGVPRLRTAEFRATPHTSRRPERTYGGQLCPKCTKERVKLEKLYLYTPMPEAAAVAEAPAAKKRGRKVAKAAPEEAEAAPEAPMATEEAA